MYKFQSAYYKTAICLGIYGVLNTHIHTCPMIIVNKHTYTHMQWYGGYSSTCLYTHALLVMEIYVYKP